LTRFLTSQRKVKNSFHIFPLAGAIAHSQPF
jgi:hypothetical protein